MTDRIKGLTITLDKDYRDDDIQKLIDAIHLLHGVASVTPSVVTLEDHMARERVRNEFREKISQFMKGLYDKD